MMKKRFMGANEVAELFGVSTGHAYKIIKRLNEELKMNGYITVAGKIPVKYLQERCYCSGIDESAAQ